uniref:60S ribosome subunit biogenesis protein NIP7 homolog n=2 Tax=Bursaphelenchus xylophilus TaxID=6326 RepID=A0A1I7RY32_BURXY
MYININLTFTFKMRPLTEEETVKLFEKLAKYIGGNIKLLLERDDGNYCFRLHRDRVFYCSEKLMKTAAVVGRKELISFGTSLGKFTKGGKFFLHITALDYLAPYAKWKVWLKPSAEQQFLYGNNILKSGVGRMTEGTEARQGVVVYSMDDKPLGFGVTAKGTAECRRADPTTLVVLHQADLGEYIRSEDTLL